MWGQRLRSLARGTCGVLRVGFVSAAAGKLAIRASSLFEERTPGWRAEPKEIWHTNCLKALRDKDIDILIVALPQAEADMVTGPELFSEGRVLAVPAAHPFARRESLTMSDIDEVELLRSSDGQFPHGWRRDRSERDTGDRFDTVAEALGLIGAGRGAYIFGAQMLRFHLRPDVRYIPILDAPPVVWVPTWLTVRDGDAIRGFIAAALDTPLADYC